MQVVDTIEALRAARAGLAGRVGVVLTMGALHAGHLALVERARAENDATLATIFINPLQFGQATDLETYPRELEHDLGLFRAAGVDLVFTPPPDTMYPQGFQTQVEVTKLTAGLEGAHRPGHFKGVTTVVAKLFNLTQPDVTYFGQKDAQQVVVIRRMARDLNFPLEISICPTVREADGLALSSRNAHLKPEERGAATTLYRALGAAGARYEKGERDPDALRAALRNVLEAEPLAAVDYVSVADARTLQEAHTPAETPLLASLAVNFGQTRLIDNCLLPLALNNETALNAVLGTA